MSAKTSRRLRLNPSLLAEQNISKSNGPVNLPFSTASSQIKQFAFSPRSSLSPNWNTVNLRTPHSKQVPFLDSKAPRKVIRAGRRGGKTVGIAILAVRAFLQGCRVLYATPTQDQIERFWFEIKRALEAQVDAGRLVKNETKHTIERPNSENRIRGKTAWNADTLRGDYADLLILDEWQLMAEDAWEQ